MMLLMLALLIVLFGCIASLTSQATLSSHIFNKPILQEMPILYQGRFRPMQAYSRLWLEERYGDSAIRRRDLPAFSGSDGSALDILWRWILDPKSLFEAPLFWISPAVRQTLDDQMKSLTHLSARQIREMAEHIDLTRIDPLAAKDWTQLLKVYAEPKDWQIIPPHTPKANWAGLKEAPEDIQKAFKTAKHALRQDLYVELDHAMQNLGALLHKRYEPLAGQIALSGPSFTLYYPTLGRLWAESLYVRLPSILTLLLCYACGTLTLSVFLVNAESSFQRIGLVFLGAGFLLHTLLLLTRCYILSRPPVSNMFETVLYVPWICMLIGWVAHFKNAGRLTLLAASSSALLLLSFIPLTGMRGGMENVQAVLDSRYWLIVHVLMVVGSYGAFFVSGLLAHGVLAGMLLKNLSSETLQNLKRAILITLYVGVALLIPGTLLGGVWAAQSWGRFWDWDPKESWALITSCMYLFVIHLYRYGHIQLLGLSFGSIIGLTSVSFTWYGVNYLLGVGLHSYGFGAGGEIAYLVYVCAEGLFLLTCALLLNAKVIRKEGLKAE